MQMPRFICNGNMDASLPRVSLTTVWGWCLRVLERERRAMEKSDRQSPAGSWGSDAAASCSGVLNSVRRHSQMWPLEGPCHIGPLALDSIEWQWEAVDGRARALLSSMLALSSSSAASVT